MGENLNDGVEGEAEDSKQRRLKLIAAVEGDNWSGVIDAQTAEAVVSAALAACTAPLWCPVALPLPDWRLACAGCVANAACWGVAARRQDILESVREKCD
jgi:hypothetical protein